MNPTRSGPSMERLLRHGLVALLTCGFSAAFLADGYYGYAENNVRQLLKTLGRDTEDIPRPDPDLTAERGRRLAESFAPATDRPATHRSAVTDALGAPEIEHNDNLYYTGPGGHLRVSIPDGKVRSAEWVTGIHSEQDQAMQRWIGLALAPLALLFLINFVRVLAHRTTVTDQAFRSGRSGWIPLSEIRNVALAEGRGRSVRVDYQSPDGNHSLILDPYDVRRLDAIVAALCARTDLPDPLAPPAPHPDEEPADA